MFRGTTARIIFEPCAAAAGAQASPLSYAYREYLRDAAFVFLDGALVVDVGLALDTAHRSHVPPGDGPSPSVSASTSESPSPSPSVSASGSDSHSPSPSVSAKSPSLSPSVSEESCGGARAASAARVGLGTRPRSPATGHRPHRSPAEARHWGGGWGSWPGHKNGKPGFPERPACPPDTFCDTQSNPIQSCPVPVFTFKTLPGTSFYVLNPVRDLFLRSQPYPVPVFTF
jgi:hypothetical protein